MYKRFFGIRDIPFSLSPDPKYLFRTESHLEVFANLEYGIENGKGLIVVTGEVGTGKTTILRSFLQSLDQSVLASYVFNPLLSAQEFFELLAGEMRLKPQSSKAAMLSSLGYVLMSRNSQGLKTVLVVDEAHLLSRALLEEIRLLLNFETSREKLLQVILCGQPELHDLLGQPELRHLKQRVSLKCMVNPLADRETGEYIDWRLRVAGAEHNFFDESAVRMVHQFSGGIPRLINNICDNALLTAFAEGSRLVTASIIRDVVEELDLTPLLASSPRGAAAIVREGALGEMEPSGREVPAIREEARRAAITDAFSNVRYIRHDSDRDRFVIQRSGDADTPSRFFSRLRVHKAG